MNHDVLVFESRPPSKILPLLVCLRPSVNYPTSLSTTHFVQKAFSAYLRTTINSSSTGYRLLLPAYARITKNFADSVSSFVLLETLGTEL
ncbi:unnamed protein product [Adineta ricciae]|uniref:Uncharacterized protein n=1 Tax=Adineta ricciae TaxID=249248 RepID=A0A815VI30_ADIRI|nr:unnamed protein product [Adineta ricciae]CAF1532272.1 unnamed protein product [Adineta ricciae]